MATPASAGEVSLQIPAAAAEGAAGGELRQRERTLNRFVRVVAFGEWAGNAFGALAFLWATGVLLGGFCSDLQQEDFWFAMVIIFIEAFRIFSRNYKLDNQSLFGTTRALRWIDMSSVRMLARPQEGNEVVLVMGMWIDLVSWLPVAVGYGRRSMSVGILLRVALLMVMSKMHLRGASQQTSQSQRSRRLLLLWAILIAYIIIYIYAGIQLSQARDEPGSFIASLSAELLTMVVAALLLISRPQRIANVTSTPWGHNVLSLAKLISAVSLAFDSVVLVWPGALRIGGDPEVDQVANGFIVSFATGVLSLGSLQTPAIGNCSLVVGCWIDAALHMLFLWYLVVDNPMLLLLIKKVWGVPISLVASIVSVVAVLLIQNLQIPAAVLEVMLSSSQFHSLKSDYPLLPDEKPNLVPAIKVFYVLAICQGSFYVAASILGLFSFFPRRVLVRQSNLTGQQGAKAVDLYYESAYSTCMDTGLFAASKTVSLASFAQDSLSSNSSETQLAGVLLLGNLLLHESWGTDSSEELRSKIIRSSTTLPTLIAMLGWADVRQRHIRLAAARVIANLADYVIVANIPSTLKVVCSLLDDDHQPDTLPDAASVNGERFVIEDNHRQPDQGASTQTTHGNGGNVGTQPTDEQLGRAQDKHGCCCYWVCRFWQRMKDKWSVLDELPLTHQDSLPILGLVILEKLAHDPDNCAGIATATYLMSKIIGLISYGTDSESSNHEQQHAVICASLNLVRRLAITRENIGAALRQELCNNSFLLNNLECVLEDSRSSPELMKLVIDILSKLALDGDARKEIGSSKVTTSKLMHAFFGKDGPTNTYYYDQSLRRAAGEALANLTIESPTNCLAIMEEPGYELIKDLKNMLCEDEYIYVAASLLQNICAHAKDKLRHYQDASSHLSSAFPMVMENIMSASGKHLEVLIGLASRICDVIPAPFIHDQFQTNRSELVQKLVDTLNSNRKPNPEYPRMRRIIVEMVISIVKFCPHYATLLREGGMMEALTKVEMNPSKVEKYMVFYGNIGIVLESGPSLAALVATTKGLILSAAPTTICA